MKYNRWYSYKEWNEFLALSPRIEGNKVTFPSGKVGRLAIRAGVLSADGVDLVIGGERFRKVSQFKVSKAAKK